MNLGRYSHVLRVRYVRIVSQISAVRSLIPTLGAGTKNSYHNIAVKNGRMRPRQKRVSFGRTDGGGNVRFEPDPDFTQQVKGGGNARPW